MYNVTGHNKKLPTWNKPFVGGTQWKIIFTKRDGGIVWIDLAGSYECVNETSVFHKTRGISLLVKKLSASQEGLCSLSILMECFTDGRYQNNVYETSSLETAGCEAGNKVSILICIFLFARFELRNIVCSITQKQYRSYKTSKVRKPYHWVFSCTQKQ